MAKGRKKKVRKFTIRRKMIFIGLCVTLAVSFIIAFMTCQTNQSNLNKIGKDQTEAVCKLMYDTISVSDVEKVNKLDMSKAESEKVYNKIHDKLVSYTKSGSIKFAYMIKEENGKYLCTVDCFEAENKDMHIPYGAECPPGTDYASIMAGNELTTPISETPYGLLINTFVPIKDNSGKAIGIFAAGYDASGLQAQIDKTNYMSLLFFAISFVLFMPAIAIMISIITKNINKVNDKLEELVSNNGDLTRKIDVTSGDELELVADNVNALLEYIRKIMINVAHNSTNLKDASSNMAENLTVSNESIVDVSAVMEEMSASMEESSASLGKVTESIEEVYGKVKGVYDRALKGADMADKIQTKADKTYSEAIAQQEEAKKMAVDMAKSVDEKIKKSKSVEEISMLTDNILNITDQTSLLALNASIEAARSGEAGKGFAVVASEIEKLAKDSAEAATQIREVSEQVIGAVEELARESENMIEFMETTALNGYESLINTSKDYKEDADTFKDNMDSFAKGSKELQTITDGINESVSCINTAVEETAKGVSSVAETATVLTTEMSGISQEANGNRDISTELLNEVNKFKLE